MGLLAFALAIFSFSCSSLASSEAVDFLGGKSQQASLERGQTCTYMIQPLRLTLHILLLLQTLPINRLILLFARPRLALAFLARLPNLPRNSIQLPPGWFKDFGIAIIGYGARCRWGHVGGNCLSRERPDGSWLGSGRERRRRRLRRLRQANRHERVAFSRLAVDIRGIGRRRMRGLAILVELHSRCRAAGALSGVEESR